MLHVVINPHTGVPIYRQIMDQIRYYCVTGALKSGDKLPSIRALSRHLGTNPTTVVKAYTELDRSGEIHMQHGKGAFVAEPMTPQSPAALEEELLRLVRPLAARAVQLGLSVDEITAQVAQEMEALRPVRSSDKGEEE